MQRLSELVGRLNLPLKTSEITVLRMCPSSAVHPDGAEVMEHTEPNSALGYLATQLILPQLQSCSGCFPFLSQAQCNAVC